MNILNSQCSVTVEEADSRSTALRIGKHLRLLPSDFACRRGDRITARQTDLCRLGLALHAADALVTRKMRRAQGQRRLRIGIPVLDLDFWRDSEVSAALLAAVQFMSCDDEVMFDFSRDEETVVTTQHRFFDDTRSDAVVCLYSGGLDSAAGLATRLAAGPDRPFVPVTLLTQKRKAVVLDRHLEVLRRVGGNELLPYRVVMETRLPKAGENRLRAREETHRLRPFLVYAIAAAVASAEGINSVEVYESGIGSVNVPLATGQEAWAASRSTHPETLRLMGKVVALVNNAHMRFDLPFFDRTKGEMVCRMRELGFADLAHLSISCVAHPLHRKGDARQCGVCTACLFRRQAMLVGGIEENADAYLTDVFTATGNTPEEVRGFVNLRAFRQQVCRLDPEGTNGGVSHRLLDHIRRTCVIDANDAAALRAIGSTFARYVEEWRHVPSPPRSPRDRRHLS